MIYRFLLICIVFACFAGLTNSPAKAAYFENRGYDKSLDAVVISIEGVINIGDDLRFREMVRGHQNVVISLNSFGGSANAALEIGKHIRGGGYQTFVRAGATCTSSCALIWLAGATRLTQKRARIGFHAVYQQRGNVAYVNGVGNALVGRYATLMGLSENAVIFITAAPPSQYNWIDLRHPCIEEIEYRII